MNEHLLEVSSQIEKVAKKYGPIPPTIYNTSYRLEKNVPVPVQRELYKTGYSFSALDENKQRKIWLYIWQKGESFQVKQQALFFLEKLAPKLVESDWAYLKKFMPVVDNWAYADSLASIYAKMHNLYPAHVRPDLVKWREAKNPWLRRQSLTSIFFYSQQRTPPYPSYSFCKSAVEQLLADDHFYVKKGVGWLLREMYNVYPEKTLTLIKKHAASIPPAGWQAATEKLPASDKKQVKALRAM